MAARSRRHRRLRREGRTVLAIGQDLFSIESYVMAQYNYSLHEYMEDAAAAATTAETAKTVTSASRPPPSRRSTTPLAYMAYTDLQTLRGLDRPADYGSGIEFADGISEVVLLGSAAGSSPRTTTKRTTTTTKGLGLQVGLWLNGSSGCRDVVSGKLDGQIDKLVSYLSGGSCTAGDTTATVQQQQLPVTTTTATTASLSFSRSSYFDKIWVRIGYEFDNPSFGYLDDPASYRAAFRRIVRACRRNPRCGRRAEFVWHSWAASVAPPPSSASSIDTHANHEEGGDEDAGFDALRAFYPGDDVVDWVGVSVFSQLYPPEDEDDGNEGAAPVVRLGNADTVRTVLAFARSRQKESMIAESAPFGGIPSRSDPWEAWFRPVLDLIDEHDVGLWSYIHCDWESQPMWHNVGFGDTRLDSNATVMRLWREHVLDNPRFISSPEDWDAGTPSNAAESGTLALVHPWTFRPFRSFGAGNAPLPASLLYFLPAAAAIALLAVRARAWCSSSPLRNDRRCRSSRSSRTSRDEGEDASMRDPNPTHGGRGYGTLATTE